MKILMVLTSHDRLGDTGHKTGFWLEEFAAPYYVFKDAGAQLLLASPKGGQPPLDPKSDEPDAQSEDTARFKADADAQKVLANTVTLEAREDLSMRSAANALSITMTAPSASLAILPVSMVIFPTPVMASLELTQRLARI